MRKKIPAELSMVNPTMDELLNQTGSRYILVVLASKRARQLLSGEECKVKNHNNKYVTNAFEEITEGKIKAGKRLKQSEDEE